MIKDIIGKVIALGLIGAVVAGGIISLVLNLIKLIGMIISFTLSLVETSVNFVLSLIGLKIALACLALCLIGVAAVALHKKTNLSSAIKKALPVCGIILIVYAVGLASNFISSSPSIMGGMVGFIYPVLFMAVFSVFLLINAGRRDQFLDEARENSPAFITKLCVVTAIGTVIGIGFGTAISAVFPNVMAGMWSIALASTVIGAIVLPIEIFAAEFIDLLPIKKAITFTADEPSESLDEMQGTESFIGLPYII